ncbi:MAG TPA: hypothetical protein ENJ82_13765 [Bacteroidetes bacterium]|nr:hypothetical protein [Bacteroidota bacterium]
MSLQEVKKIEGIAPKHDDKWGYVYELNLSEKGRFFLEYICKKSDNRIVSSIVINIFLKDEGITSELYSEMEAALRADYGLAEGSSTNLEWQESEQNLYITLRVLDDKKSISLNYVNIGGF